MGQFEYSVTFCWTSGHSCRLVKTTSSSSPRASSSALRAWDSAFCELKGELFNYNPNMELWVWKEEQAWDTGAHMSGLRDVPAASRKFWRCFLLLHHLTGSQSESDLPHAFSRLESCGNKYKSRLISVTLCEVTQGRVESFCNPRTAHFTQCKI